MSSRVDVLVATPGRCGPAAKLNGAHADLPPGALLSRLVAHMRSTAGFTLQHLQFLVVDEADRLLRQAYQARCWAAPTWSMRC